MNSGGQTPKLTSVSWVDRIEQENRELNNESNYLSLELIAFKRGHPPKNRLRMWWIGATDFLH